MVSNSGAAITPLIGDSPLSLSHSQTTVPSRGDLRKFNRSRRMNLHNDGILMWNGGRRLRLPYLSSGPSLNLSDMRARLGGHIVTRPEPLKCPALVRASYRA